MEKLIFSNKSTKFILSKKHIFPVLFVFIFSSGCLEDENDGKDRYEIIQITVAPEMGKGLGGFDGYYENADHILIKEEGSKDWKKLHPLSIDGFNYEEGYEYILKVNKIYLSNPPQDASSINYELIEILSKEKKESR